MGRQKLPFNRKKSPAGPDSVLPSASAKTQHSLTFYFFNRAECWWSDNCSQKTSANCWWEQIPCWRTCWRHMQKPKVNKEIRCRIHGHWGNLRATSPTLFGLTFQTSERVNYLEKSCLTDSRIISHQWSQPKQCGLGCGKVQHFVHFSVFTLLLKCLQYK